MPALHVREIEVAMGLDGLQRGSMFVAQCPTCPVPFVPVFSEDEAIFQCGVHAKGVHHFGMYPVAVAYLRPREREAA